MDPRDIATFADTDLTSSDVGRQRRRILVYLVGLLTIVVLYALAYQASLSLFEGRQVSFPKADVRARTGVTVIAVERGAEFRSDIGPEFAVEPGDSLIVAGIDREVNRFSTLVES
jgi:hypothetical protein